MSKKYNRVDGGVQMSDEDNNDNVASDSDSDCWKYWCRLCAKEHHGNMNVFHKNKNNVLDTTLATAIGKFFWVNIRPGDELPQYVCNECETLVNSLCRFTERINKVQTMFAVLQNSKENELIDPNDVRLQFGLIDEDRQHLISSPAMNQEDFDIQSEEDEEEAEEDETKHQQKLQEESVGDIDQDSDEKSSKSDDENDLDSEIMHEIVLEMGTDIETEEFEEAELETADSENQFDQEEFQFLDENDDESMVFELRKEIKKLKEARNISKSMDSDKNDESAAEESAAEESAAESAENGNENEYEDEDYKTTFKYEDSNPDNSGSGDGEEMDVKPEFLESGAQGIKENETKNDKAAGGVEVLIDGVKVIRPPPRRRGRPSKPRPLDSDPNAPQKKRRKIKTEENPDDPTLAEYKFECSLCPKKYKSIVIYRKHMLEIHNIVDETVVEYNCEQCPKVFPSERSLASHLRTHLPLELKQIYPCPYCEKRFTKESIMVQHISGIHLNEKPFMCEECGRPLKTLAALKEHKLTHTDDCPFECKVCHRGFKNKARLKIHSDIHTDTAYRCNICGVQLNTRRTLSMHMLVHSEVKAFKCDYCGNEFKRAKALKNHLIIHSGLKPYTCNFCGKSFSNGSNCRSHKKKAHPVELAALEAAGKQEKHTSIPKLDQLRAVTKVAEKLKPVTKQSGLPANWRELLLKAEARANFLAEQQNESPDELNDSQDTKDEMVEVEAQLAAMDS